MVSDVRVACNRDVFLNTLYSLDIRWIVWSRRLSVECFGVGDQMIAVEIQ